MSHILQAWLATFLVTALLVAPFIALAIISMRRGMKQPAPDEDSGAPGTWRGE